MTTSWSVYSMVREPTPVLTRFVEHHLSLGASYIHLFFDDPDDPAYWHFANQPGVVATRCTPEYWTSIKRNRRPAFVERRQLVNGRIAYERCLTDWQAHFDADELMVTGHETSVGQQLSTVSPDYHFAHLSTIEPIIDPQATGELVPFRRSILHLKHRARQKVYGDALPGFKTGLFGHYQGKSILRCGLPGGTHGIHWPRGLAHLNKRGYELETSRIAHMHCENRDDWIGRIVRKAENNAYNLRTGNFRFVTKLRQNMAHLPELHEAPTEVLVREFFDMVAVLTPVMRNRLEYFNLLEYHATPALPGHSQTATRQMSEAA